jgi:hypothetical protein
MADMRDYLEQREKTLEARVERLVNEKCALESLWQEARDLLQHFRRNEGECVGDNPRWLEAIDRLLKRGAQLEVQ